MAGAGTRSLAALSRAMRVGHTMSARGNRGLRGGGHDPLEAPVMSLRWSARVREMYDVVQPNEPPTAPLDIEHELDFTCDFSSPYDRNMFNTVSTGDVVFAFVLFFGTMQLLRWVSAQGAIDRYLDPGYTCRESPYDLENSPSVYGELFKMNQEDRIRKRERLAGVTEEQSAMRKRLISQPYLARED